MKESLMNDCDYLLALVQKRFYAGTACRDFHRDRRMLVYALTWPARWLDRRGLKMDKDRYDALMAERIENIVKHGKKKVYQQYFPRYLLKALQDYFARHGDELYFELKHIRNAMQTIEALLKQRGPAQPQQDDHTRILAQAHAIVRPKAKRKQPACRTGRPACADTADRDTNQMTLF